MKNSKINKTKVSSIIWVSTSLISMLLLLPLVVIYGDGLEGHKRLFLFNLPSLLCIFCAATHRVDWIKERRIFGHSIVSWFDLAGGAFFGLTLAYFFSGLF